MKYLKIVLPALLLAMSPNVSASLIDNDTYTTDSVTGLNWLDMSFSDGQSYNQVSSMINGGSLSGWRFATSSELDILIGNAVGGLYSTGWSSSTDVAMNNLINLLGYTLENSRQKFAIGYVDSTGLSYADARQFGTDLQLGGYIRAVNDLGWDQTNFNLESPYIGSFLVEVSPVPIPAAAWLFGSALLGFFGFSRRKANA